MRFEKAIASLWLRLNDRSRCFPLSQYRTVQECGHFDQADCGQSQRLSTLAL